MYSYTYDSLGQLLKAAGDTTYTYTYDSVGNILTASDGTTTHTYSYASGNFRDTLTAYDGVTITSGSMLNACFYYNGYNWNMSWNNGLELYHISNTTTGQCTLNLRYDSDGLRTQKTANGVAHTYQYAGGKLLRETYGSNTLDFFYDASGNPYALKYNGTVYYYILNLQGDVERVINASGSVVAYYAYTPYGEIFYQSGTMADINPLRYRGYYYDTETGLYYLQSRYYDPSTGRFLCPDAFASTGQGIIGYNMFAYCNNNPVNYSDFSGSRPEYVGDPNFEWAWDIGWWLKDKWDEQKEKWKKRQKEVEELKKTGGEISAEYYPQRNEVRLNNSYQVTDIWTMGTYSYHLVHNSEYSDFFEGSPEGVFIEWGFHNVAVNYPDLDINRAKDTDFGPTIFDDTHYPENIVMWATYYIVFPDQFENDLRVYLSRQTGGK